MPKIRINQTDLTGSVQQAAISNTVFIPVRASKKISPTVVTNIESFETGDLAYVKKDSLGYVLCKHLLGIGLPILVQGVAADTNTKEYSMSKEEWNKLTDKNLYPIRFLTYGDLDGDRLCQDMVNVANVRKDCVALLDLNENQWDADDYNVTKIRTNIEGTIANGEFAAAFTPWFYSKVSDLYIPSYTTEDIINVSDKSKITNFLLKFKTSEKPKGMSDYIEVNWYLSDESVSPYFYKAEFKRYDLGSYIIKHDFKDTDTTELSDDDFVEISKVNTLYDYVANQNYYTSSQTPKYMRTMQIEDPKSDDFDSSKCYIKGVDGDFYPYSSFEIPHYTQVENFEDDKTDPIGTKIPAAFGYLFAYANSIKNNPEWYAVAGFDRGVIPELSSVAYEYCGSDIEILQARGKERAVDLDDEADNVGMSINPIAYIRPAGHIIYGNRTMKSNTASKGTTATSFLNVRNLVSAITKVMYDGAKKYTFEQNNDLLWLNFQAYVRPTLEQMKNGNGIADYNFVKEPTNAKARLKAKVNIIPIEAVEDFDLSIIMTDDETLISG